MNRKDFHAFCAALLLGAASLIAPALEAQEPKALPLVLRDKHIPSPITLERPIDFCALLDSIHTHLQDPLFRKLLVFFFGGEPFFAQQPTCAEVDVNGFVYADGEGEAPWTHQPNGMLDYIELGLLAEILNHPELHDDVIDTDAVRLAFEFNYQSSTGALHVIDVNEIVPTLDFLLGDALDEEFESSEQRTQYLYRLANFFNREMGLIFAGYLGLRDESATQYVLLQTTMFDDYWGAAFGMGTNPSMYEQSPEEIGALGDVDNDECTQLQEYQLLLANDQLTLDAYTSAALNSAPGECMVEGDPVVEGEGGIEGVMEGEGNADGEGLVDGEGEGEAMLEGEGEGESVMHSADQNGDHAISLAELLGVIQLYNANEFHCELAVYQPGPGTIGCDTHASDYAPADWSISLSELLRSIQLFSSGGYKNCTLPDADGFCTIP